MPYADRAASLAYDRARNATPERKARVAANKRLQAYNLTADEFHFMLASQQYRCAICEGDTPGGRGGWHVDHCHDANQVRAILCHGCNTSLGHFRDSPVRLRAAADYIERHQCLMN